MATEAVENNQSAITIEIFPDFIPYMEVHE